MNEQSKTKDKNAQGADLADVFEISQWLDHATADAVWQFADTLEITPEIPQHGRFAGQPVSLQRYHQWNDKDPLGQLLAEKMHRLYGPHSVNEVVFQELQLSWDIHCDYRRAGCVNPWYSLLIPLQDIDSRTVIFDQTAELNDFWKYKETAEKAANAVSEQIWQELLSHCWDFDREYLSIRYISRPWRKGNLLSFRRNIFHASDNFYLRNNHPKRFLQILIDRP